MSALQPQQSISIDKLGFENDFEEQASTAFTTANIKFFKNILAETAMEKMNLHVDPANPAAHAFDSEFLRGRITAIQEILMYAHPAGTPN